jgi:hypothetical protein
MPSYTRGSNNLIAQTRGKGRDGIFRPNQRRRPMFFADNYEREAFTGESRSPEGKLIFGSTDDRGRVRSEYFTDERGRLKIPYISIGETATYNAGSANSITFTDNTAWYGWTTAALLSDDSVNLEYGKPYVYFEGNATADRVVIGQEGAGVWMANLAYSVHSGGAGVQLSCAVWKNGVLFGRMRSHRALSGSADMGAAASSSLWALEPGDYLDVRFKNENGVNNRSIEIHYVNFSLFRVNHKR